jgi:hypothetical protein
LSATVRVVLRFRLVFPAVGLAVALSPFLFLLPIDDPIHFVLAGRRSLVPRYRFWGGGSDHTQPLLSVLMVGACGLIPHPPRQPIPRAKKRRPARVVVERVNERVGRMPSLRGRMGQEADQGERTDSTTFKKVTGKKRESIGG